MSCLACRTLESWKFHRVWILWSHAQNRKKRKRKYTKERTSKETHRKWNDFSFVFLLLLLLLIFVFGKNLCFSWQCFIHPVPINLRRKYKIPQKTNNENVHFRVEWILFLKMNRWFQLFHVTHHHVTVMRQRNQVQWLTSIWLCQSCYYMLLFGFAIDSQTLCRCCRVVCSTQFRFSLF